ncbi:hypothetical protein FOCG_18256 [Fusarium oxysporum f. sp. radicis-lycopersici 26381]|nr:hypothetical protein FOWG_16591 [Fusarium oxysporum f. sp. lycopersici MN25]EXL39128.1 hypothetical protein FOCG_18256 [Fusarium oxysporum f. sp. radicis-lycopersici 26381]
MDGVPGVTQDPIPPGGNFTYRFSTVSEYGFFWYHSHFRAYYNDAIRGPLLIRPAASRQRPFATLAQDKDELAALLAAERNATNVLLNDWTHELSDVVFARYIKTGAFPSCVDSILANGQGRVQCLPKSALEMSDMPGMEALNPRGCMPPMMFKPGFNMSSLPPETCTNTTSPLLVIPADQSRGWLALNLVNSGAVSALRVSLDGHSMFVYAADGLYTKLQKVNVLHMELGQRYSVMIKLDQSPGNYYLRFATFPSGDMQQVLEGQAIVSYNVDNSSAKDVMEDPAKSWMYINGSAKADVALLDPSALSPFDSDNSPPSGRPDKALSFEVSQTGIVTWVIDRAPFSEPDVPIIYGENSSGWNSNTTIHLPINSTIDIIMSISNKSMDMMGHPMHLHGHKFWVLGSGEGSFPYTKVTDAPADLINLQDPPYRDTMGLPSQGWAAIRYVTDNPGTWMFHCHLQWHIAVGMAMVLVEGGDQLPALVGQYNKTADRSGATELMASRYSPSATLVAIVVVAITLWY